MTKHTPGPWELNRFEQQLIGAPTKNVARCIVIPADGPERYRIAAANARLIAAAPDLLEAAKIAEAYLKQIGYKPVEHLKIIIDAIRKAEGWLKEN